VTRQERAVGATAFATSGGGARRALLLHCSLASKRAWRPLMDRLDDALAMTAIDLPGHGDSADWDHGGDLLIRAAEIAATFCDGPSDVIGHSFGAAVALRLAVEHPELIRALVLVEPVFFAAASGTDAHAAHRARFAPFAEALEAGDRAEATRLFTGMWGGGVAWGDMPEAQRAAMVARIHLIRESGPGLEEDVGDILGDGRLEAVEAPVLCVAGGRSAPVIHAIHARLVERLPDAREAVIDGAGHMLPMTHADDLAALVRGHLGLD